MATERCWTEPGGCGLPGHDRDLRLRRQRGGPPSRKCHGCHKEQARVRQAALYAKRRAEAVAHYGGRCTCCGESELRFLAIDHIDGGGNAHRREIGVTGAQAFYRWLQRAGYPAGFRILCANCNQATAYGLECPHRAG